MKLEPQSRRAFITSMWSNVEDQLGAAFRVEFTIQINHQANTNNRLLSLGTRYKLHEYLSDTLRNETKTTTRKSS